MAARCSVTNSSVKASAITSSGTGCVGWMLGPPSCITEAGWCSVFHQSTENLMIGRLIAPTSVRIAAARAGARRILDRAPQRDDAEIHQEQDQHRGQPRVPHPIGAPHRPAPQRAGDEAEEREGGADRGRGLGGDVGERMAPDQRAERGDAHQRPAEHAEPRRRHMDEHDLHRRALLVVVRRDDRRGRARAAKASAVDRRSATAARRSASCEEARRVGEIDRAWRMADVYC